MHYFLYLSLLCNVLLFVNSNAIAQNNTTLSPVEQFEKSWIQKEFPIDLYNEKDMSGKRLDPKLPTFVVLGFYHCIPCKRQMPAVLDFAVMYKDVNVVYITFDSIELINYELKIADATGTKHNDLFIFSIPKERLSETRLSSFGYPMKFFVNTQKIVYNIDSYSDTKLGMDALIEKWHQYLKSTYQP